MKRQAVGLMSVQFVDTYWSHSWHPNPRLEMLLSQEDRHNESYGGLRDKKQIFSLQIPLHFYFCCCSRPSLHEYSCHVSWDRDSVTNIIIVITVKRNIRSMRDCWWFSCVVGKNWHRDPIEGMTRTSEVVVTEDGSVMFITLHDNDEDE